MVEKAHEPQFIPGLSEQIWGGIDRIMSQYQAQIESSVEDHTLSPRERDLYLRLAKIARSVVVGGPVGLPNRLEHLGLIKAPKNSADRVATLRRSEKP